MPFDLENELLGLIGHRFRRNLINITSLANSVLADNDPHLTETNINDLGQIKAEAVAALDLIDDILSLAHSSDVANPLIASDGVSLLNDIAQSVGTTADAFHKAFLYRNQVAQVMFQCDPKRLIDVVSSAASVLCQISHQSNIRLTVIASKLILTIQIDDGEFDCAPDVQSFILQQASLGLLMRLLDCARMIRSMGGSSDMCNISENGQQYSAIRFQFPIVSPDNGELC